MKRLIAIVCLSLLVLSAFSQATTRRFPASINNPSINITAPFISLDGSALLFTSDYGAGYGGETLVYFSQREAGDWKPPVELPKQFNAKTNFSKGYTLSPDGKTLYLTSIKSGGVGGYDMWSADVRGGELKNLFLPVNTKSHEGCPSFTTDGSTMYFMRCEKMEREKADKCKIMVSRKKPTGQWEEPTELPATINTGNSQTPRMMADGETLIFSSNKITPSKGGMDLYVTKFKNGVWSAPLPLDFVNTDKDDQFVSAQANGRYLLKETPGKFKSEIVEFLIPDNLRPRGVMKVDGVVKDIKGVPTAAYVSVTDLFNNKRIFTGQPAADGSFFFYLLEGGAYELSVDHAESSYSYYSKQYDLMENTLLRNDKLDIVLKKLTVGDELDLDAIRFKPESFELDHAASELRRLSRLLKNSPGLTFEIQVLLAGYVEDSVQSVPDLTEVETDSTNIILEAIDSTGQMLTRDSLVIKTRYHNDRTEKQGNAIIDQLVALGTDRKSLSLFVNSRPEEILENRKTSVRLVVRKKK